MDAENFKIRTKRLALGVIKLVEALPVSKTCDVLGKQLLRSATSVGANYRAACIAKSMDDFIYKMKIVEEELNESIYWMELLEDSGKLLKDGILRAEANELYAMVVASIKTAKNNNKSN
ncbi:MAG: four helix bundle protein [Candidatus Firestonebacteria bacterium]